MSQVKHNAHDKSLSPRTGVKLSYAVERAEERAGPEDVGEQTLMRGLDTAFPFFRLGLSRSSVGRRSHDRPHNGCSGIPLPWSRPHCCTIDVCDYSLLTLVAMRGQGSVKRSSRPERSAVPDYIMPAEFL
jgi:hypothetical protein